MSCKSDTLYNFASASGQDSLVHGSARPGAKGQRCFNEADKVTEQEVKEWADFMKEKGITRVIGLLNDSEIDTYEKPPVETLKALGIKAVNVPVGQSEAERAQAGPRVLQELEDATAAGEKVVVHCWGGGKRSGSALAAWLVAHHNLSPEAAVDEVNETSAGQGSTRAADLQQVKQLLSATGAKL